MNLNGILKSIFGSKSERDVKKLKPTLDKIKAIYPEISQLSNDQLRERTQEIRQSIAQYVQPQRDEIARIKSEIETLDYEQREPLWDKIDKLEKEVLDRIEDKLNEVLPEVFAIVKDTARRFAENETLEVTATDFDRQLAAQGKDFLHIEGDKAIYQNHWMAGGNEVTWDMVHYDVQLIGGIVKEMQGLGVDVKGFNTAFAGDVPLGAGMSSSAALESCFAFALNDLFGDNRVSKWDLVLAGVGGLVEALCRSEHERLAVVVPFIEHEHLEHFCLHFITFSVADIITRYNEKCIFRYICP